MQPKRVLIVDDSALMRQLLTELFENDPRLTVVGTAADPFIAVEKIRDCRPDVLTLDVEMPQMDGLTFLEHLMRRQPMPVVMISSVTEAGCAATLRALELGAIDFVTKPKLDMRSGTVAMAEQIIQKILTASTARVRPARARPAGAAAREQPVAAPGVAAGASRFYQMTHKIIAIGASTGGTEALSEVIGAMPPDAPGILIVQHMPENFTRSFADRLDRQSAIRVREARDGDRLLPGHALLAPGNHHMTVQRSGAVCSVRLNMQDTVNHHRPSVDVLFDSCCRNVGADTVAALLTGMGDDGARGLTALRQAGARTVAQDEATCVVFGMPREAILRGGAEEVLPLEKIAAQLLRWSGHGVQAARPGQVA